MTGGLNWAHIQHTASHAPRGWIISEGKKREMASQSQSLMGTSRMMMPRSTLKHGSWMASGKGPQLKGLLLPHSHTLSCISAFLPSCLTLPGDALWSALKPSPVLFSLAASCATFLFASATREVLRVQLLCNIYFLQNKSNSRALSHLHRWFSGLQWIFLLDLLVPWDTSNIKSVHPKTTEAGCSPERWETWVSNTEEGTEPGFTIFQAKCLPNRLFFLATSPLLGHTWIKGLNVELEGVNPHFQKESRSSKEVRF